MTLFSPNLEGQTMANAPIVLKYNDWPQADKTAWDALFEAADIFEDSGPCADWAEGSRRKRLQGYGQWLSFLLRCEGKAIELAPSERVTEARVRAYTEECEARLAPKSTAGLLLDLYVIARAMSPELDWRWFETACNRLRKKADKKSLPPPLPITAQEIFQWSLKRMQEVSIDMHFSAKRRASQFRQALMIGFLISRPVRRRAVLAMQANQHVSRLSDGFNIQFCSADMKDKKDREFPLPRALVEPMRDYLKVHRPILLADKTSDGLWFSQYGEPIKPDGSAASCRKSPSAT
jgi:integrase/recombinase XerD